MEYRTDTDCVLLMLTRETDPIKDDLAITVEAKEEDLALFEAAINETNTTTRTRKMKINPILFSVAFHLLLASDSILM